MLHRQLPGWLAERLGAWADGTDASHALFQAAMLETGLEAHLVRFCETLVDSLERYLGSMPGPARDGARTRALILEISTQRVLTLASASRLPADTDAVLEALAGMWFQTLCPGGRCGPRP